MVFQEQQPSFPYHYRVLSYNCHERRQESVQASYGHDDIVMTLCQLPMLKNTPKYKDFVEEFELHNVVANIPNAQINQNYEGLSMIGEMVSISDPFNNVQQVDDFNWNTTLSNDLWNF